VDNLNQWKHGFSVKAINSELGKRGHNERLEKANGYFFFKRGGATDWIDQTVQVPTVNSLTLEQWIEEFRSLKMLNAEIVCTPSRGGEAPRKPAR